MRLLIILPVLALFALTSAGCASDGSLKNPFSSEPDPAQSAPASNFFFSEFNDIPIPNDLSETRSDTFITFAPSGVKCGVQHFSGRVELVSLMNTMRRNMAANGWKLRSLLRAKESVMVFDKPDRMAAFQISDGMLTTDMRIFVTSRLEGDAPPSDPGYSPGSTSSQPITQ